MDDFCGSEFWNLNVTWNTIDPDFTECFKNTVLVWCPCAFLWIFVPLQVSYMIRNKKTPAPCARLFIAKLGIAVLLILLSVVDLGIAVGKSSHEAVYNVEYITPIIKIATFTEAAIIISCNRRYGVHRSGLLFLFWCLLALCGAFQFKSSLNRRAVEVASSYSITSSLIYYPLVCIGFLFNFFSDAASTSGKYSQNERPQENASYPSSLFLAWFDPVCWKGFQKPLTRNDLWPMKHDETAGAIVTTFDKHRNGCSRQNESPRGETASTKMAIGEAQFHGRKQKLSGSILQPLWQTFRTPIVVGGLLKLLEDSLKLSSPEILKWFLAFISLNQELWKGYMYAVLFLITRTLATLVTTQHENRMSVVGLRIRTVLIAAIYRKSLRLGNSCRNEYSVGEIVNLMSVDAQTLMDITKDLHTIWVAPFKITVTFYLLWNILGEAVLASVAVLCVALLLQILITKKLQSLRSLLMKKKDAKTKLENEILSGIKVLRLCAWEPYFEKQILKIRGEEISLLKKREFYASFINFIRHCLPALMFLSSLVTYVMLDEANVLNADKVFVSLALFNVIQMSLVALPELTIKLVQAIVSLRRIEKFINSDDLNPENVQHTHRESHPLVIENGTFTWSTEEYALPTLREINLRIERHRLVAIVGSVGSGKTSLLLAFLGEMNRLKGRIYTEGSIAYISQQAWIQNASVRDNILFGNPYDEQFYNRVLDACALCQDLKILPAGDRTEIGEKGINLSGGQKQRISLARAVYNGADVYLFDDPLSAVDVHVGNHIFDNVIGPNGMLKNKTRVLVTHGISYLPRVDSILVLENGGITECGTYPELLRMGGAFAEFLLLYLLEVDPQAISETEEIDKIAHELESTIDKDELKRKLSRATSRVLEIQNESRTFISNQSSEDTSSGQDTTIKQRSASINDGKHAKKKSAANYQPGESYVTAENTELGSVKWKVYLHYLNAVSYRFGITFILLKIIAEIFSVGTNVWLNVWTSDETATSNGVADATKRNEYLGVYGALVFGQTLCNIVGLLAGVIGCIRSSKLLHRKLLFSILRAPIGFFDVTPSGRILNRFGTDIESIDNDLPRAIQTCSFALVTVLARIVIISVSTPMFISLIIPIALLYYFIKRFYIATSRQLKRLESISRSPIYSHFSESINGVQTIRAYGAQQRFIRELDSKVDHNQACSYFIIIADLWLTVRLDMLGNLTIFFTALFALLQRDSLSAEIVGLSMSYALQMTNYLNWFVQASIEYQTKMISVERVKEFSEIPQEAPWEIAGSNISDDKWPSEGHIEFRDYKVRHRKELDLVLRGLSFRVKGGEKIGIVGRTGAGKSSLTLALFRIIEATSGKILIDDVDISKIGLHTLRSRLTIIPQDPVLFSGTLRMNLDPLDSFTDTEIWNALEHANLKCFVNGSSDGLMYEITEEGGNLSAGQRQLICLARALLRRTKILIMDEVTSSVDMETDDFIHRTIREKFRDCTVLTIAHRLNTILDSDRVIVLDNGYIAEYDTPEVLLRNKNSLFYSMAKDAGLSV